MMMMMMMVMVTRLKNWFDEWLSVSDTVGYYIAYGHAYLAYMAYLEPIH